VLPANGREPRPGGELADLAGRTLWVGQVRCWPASCTLHSALPAGCGDAVWWWSFFQCRFLPAGASALEGQRLTAVHGFQPMVLPAGCVLSQLNLHTLIITVFEQEFY
jgi:hypothetical protein